MLWPFEEDLPEEARQGHVEGQAVDSEAAPGGGEDEAGAEQHPPGSLGDRGALRRRGLQRDADESTFRGLLCGVELSI